MAARDREGASGKARASRSRVARSGEGHGAAEEWVDGRAPQGLEAQVVLLRRAVVFLVVACLATSVCFNVYLVRENGAVKDKFLSYQRRLQGLREMHQVTARIVADLQHVAKDTPPAQRILARHQGALAELGIDSLKRPPPAP